MHIGSENWPVWSNPTDELLLVRLKKKLMLVTLLHHMDGRVRVCRLPGKYMAPG